MPLAGWQDCTLREALNVANADADANTVSFATGLTGMTVTNLLTPDGFVVSSPITINGPGARLLAISGGDINRCLQVNGGPAVINGLSFAHGSNSIDLLPGGGILSGNGADLTLNDCSFSGNDVASSSGIVDFGYGGGVAQYLAGQLNINRCTFADNTAGTGGGGLANLGGTVVVTNSTFTRNSAPSGGAIFSSSTPRFAQLDRGWETKRLWAGNGWRSSAGWRNTSTVTNSVIAGNTSTGTSPNVSGTFRLGGIECDRRRDWCHRIHRWYEAIKSACSIPKSACFGNHGGLTDTLPLLAGSAAINKANATTRAGARSARLCA